MIVSTGGLTRIVVAAMHSTNRRVCELFKREFEALIWRVIVVVVLRFYVSPTATVVGKRDYDFKSHPQGWRIHEGRSLTTTPQRPFGE